MSRRLLYVEVPAFYAAVERAAHPALLDRPLIVGGDPRKRGIVQAATPDARRVGVEDGMLVLDALSMCPGARALRTDMARYRETAKRLRSFLCTYSDRVESEGLGAAILEVSERSEDSELLGGELRRALREGLQLPSQVGIAPVRFVAQIAAREADDSGVRVVRPTEVRSFLEPLPAERLPGVGPNTVERLHEMGLHTVGDIAGSERSELETALGNHGLAIWAAARGQGSDQVRAASHSRTVSQEITLSRGERDRAVLQQTLSLLAERVTHHLELEVLSSKRLVLKLRFEDGEQITRTLSRDRPVFQLEEIRVLAEELLGRAEVGDRALRLVGIAATQLSRRTAGDAQLPLFPRAE